MQDKGVIMAKKVTFLQILAGAKGVEGLSKRRFRSIKTALKVNKLSEEISSYHKFYMNEELKLINAYAEKDDKGNILWTPQGGLNISDEAKRAEFNKELNKLQTTEVEIAMAPLEIDAETIVLNKDEEGFSPSEFTGISTFVSFYINDDEEPDHAA